MKPLLVPDAPNVILALQDEIRRSGESRYDHRLHGLLLVAQGLSCGEVARLLGDSPRTVHNWVHLFEAKGLAGLTEGQRSGRLPRLSARNLAKIAAVLRRTPAAVGLSGNLWDGKTLSEFADQKLGVKLGVRQCQRLFRKLGFRLRKPRPLIARADPALQAAHKKSSTR
jgi:transposase